MKCPDRKYLHLFTDGLLSPDTQEYRHIKNCEKCMKEVNFYHNIANNIKKSSVSIPSTLVDSIKAKVKEKIHTVEYKKPTNYVLEDDEIENLAAARKDIPDNNIDPLNGKNKS